MEVDFSYCQFCLEKQNKSNEIDIISLIEQSHPSDRFFHQMTSYSSVIHHEAHK